VGALILDANVLIALLDRSDAHYEKAVDRRRGALDRHRGIRR